MKVWSIAITVDNFESSYTFYNYFKTKQDAAKRFVELLSEADVYVDHPQEKDFEDVKGIMTVGEFEELFNVNVKNLIIQPTRGL